MPQIIDNYSHHNAELHMYLSILSLLNTSKSKDEFEKRFRIINRNKNLGNFDVIKDAIKYSRTKTQIKRALLSKIRKKNMVIKKLQADHPEIDMVYNLSMSFVLSRGIN